MKKLAIVLLLLLCTTCLLTACQFIQTTYKVTSEKGSYTVTVGDELDFKSYFKITSSDGKNIPVTDDMIDDATADTSKPGAFIITCSYEGSSCTIIFVVNASSNNDQGGNDNQGGNDDQGSQVTPTSKSIDLTKAENLSGTPSGQKITFVKDGLKVTIDKANSTTSLADQTANNWAARVYAGATLTVEYPQMTQIVITCDGNTYNNKTYISGFDGMQVAGATFSRQGNVITITFANKTDKFVSAGLLSQVRILSIEVLTTHTGTVTPPSGDQDDDQGGTTTPPSGGTTVDLSNVFANYADYEDWNFKLVFDLDADDASVATEYAYTYVYYYDGYDCYYHDQLDTWVDYVIYTDTDILYYLDNEDGTHTKISYNDNYEDFADCYYYIDWVDLSSLANFHFVTNDNHYSATDANDAGNTIFGEYEDCYYTSFDLYISNGKITKIVAVQQDDYYDCTFTYTVELSNYGSVTVDVSDLVVENDNAGGGTVVPPSGDQGGTNPDDVMPEQSFKPSNHTPNDDVLYDAIAKYDKEEGYLPSTALPSQGTYNVLVVPVEFSNDKFTNQELTDLNYAFNSKANTGWESVSSYYQTSSYGKLNITFDIVGKVSLNATHQSFVGDNYGEDILKLALDAVDARGFDFSKYDNDNNGVVDGVYIIYSAPVDFDEADYYWAYVSSYSTDLAYDGVDVYTFLFAGVDFMYEDIESSDPSEFYPIKGLKLNATTYIHETGHMLGLDDYYDYHPYQGSDKGLGGADMMDYNVGDHNAYSKLMLGWVTPTVITNSQTVTISAFESSGQFIMILLDYDGTYFSEYLIIDLYSATGLNAMHAGMDDTYLFDGANFGARIYHVDSSINNPYSDDYYSFTDNNNSISRDPLLKLVEADGDKNFESDQVKDIYGDYFSVASQDDLWQTGDVFGDIQPNYTRNDGKVVNFDIRFDSVTATSATITITFDVPE